MVKLFDVNLPQITKWELKEKLLNLESSKKHSLYWLYSEFLLRANRNGWYKKVLNEGTFSAIDGKGLHWSMYRIMSFNILPEVYNQHLIRLPLILRIPMFILLFVLQLIINLINGFWTLVIRKTNFSTSTYNETVLGRDFTYEILKICNIKQYKTLIIGGSNEDDIVSKQLINNLYPNIDLHLWTRKTNSLLMKDQINKSTDPAIGLNLTTSNIYNFFPDLIDAKKTIRELKPDVILVCIGGASGKQEFFIHNLMNDNDISFTLATGLGAAIDHIGGGRQQTLPPKWAQNNGMEWIFRFMNQPYRRMRIVDSILTLYWWTTINMFTQLIDKPNFKAINKIHDNEHNILIQSQKGNLPNQIGYSLPINAINPGSSIEQSGIDFLNNKYNLYLTNSNLKSVPEKGRKVTHSISLINFIKNKCIYTSDQYYMNFFIANKPFQLPNGSKFVDSEEYLNISNPDYIQFEKN